MHFRSTLAASAGGAIEWYDFVVLGLFAGILGQEFFPKDNIYIQNLLVFFVFASGYFTRPIGALIFGHIGDKYGRKKSLFYTMVFSGFSTSILALTPSYNQIGILASFLFLIARLIQGLSVGGSITGALVYVSEITPKNKLCFWMSQVINGINRGWIMASIVSILLFHYMPKDMLYSWGWRLAFVIGMLIMFIAIYLRNQLPESRHHEILKEQHEVHNTPVQYLFREQFVKICYASGVSLLFASLTIVLLVYLPSYLRYYSVPQKYIAIINLISSLTFGFTLPIFGFIGDKLGARSLLIISSITMICFAMDITHLLSGHDALHLYLGALLISTITASVVAATPPLLVSIFPTKTRYTGVGFSYNIVGSLIVTTWPVIIPMLNKHIHSLAYTSGVMLMFSAAVTLTMSILLKTQQDYFPAHILAKWKPRR